MKIPGRMLTVMVGIGSLAVMSVGSIEAASKSSSSTIHGCEAKHSHVLSLRSGKHCPKGSKAVSWNAKGVKGSRGAQGPGMRVFHTTLTDCSQTGHDVPPVRVASIEGWTFDALCADHFSDGVDVGLNVTAPKGTTFRVHGNRELANANGGNVISTEEVDTPPSAPARTSTFIDTDDAEPGTVEVVLFRPLTMIASKGPSFSLELRLSNCNASTCPANLDSRMIDGSITPTQ